MKKILSLALASAMIVTALPVAYAAETQDYSLGTAVNLVGPGGAYTVTVPASMELGQVGTVTANGYWKSYETLIVTADDEIEVTNAETRKTTTVKVNFDGIESLGNDLGEMTIPVDISLDDSNIIFGSWSGVIEYNVQLNDGIIEFTIGDLGTFQALEGMTWAEWLESDYNTDGFYTEPYDRVKHPSMTPAQMVMKTTDPSMGRSQAMVEEVIDPETYIYLVG